MELMTNRTTNYSTIEIPFSAGDYLFRGSKITVTVVTGDNREEIEMVVSELRDGMVILNPVDGEVDFALALVKND